MSELSDKPESFAWKPVVMFSASLLVLSVSLNNAGFKSIIDAWSASIVAGIEQKPNQAIVIVRTTQLPC